jgi:hypothetical protein
VGYDLSQAASRYVSNDQLSRAVTAAFAAWTGASCAGGGHPSIAVDDLGPVTCARASYDEQGGPNQSVVVFHDDVWPYEAEDRKKSHRDLSPVIALTTVTFDVQSGEIFEADVELNSADYSIIPFEAGRPPPAPSAKAAFDLQAVLTHELGHFLGLAHSPLADAVMNASGDTEGGQPKRALSAEDTLGICSVYPPDGSRSVSLIVDPSGRVPAGSCDPTPHHGFRSDCP